jgi:hypothetical protein
MAVVSRKSKRWFSLRGRHDFYTTAKTSLDPRRPKRVKQSHDKVAVGEITPCTCKTPNDLSDLVTVDSNSATSKPLDSIDPDSTTLKLSQPPFLRDEEGSLSSCDWNSTSIGLKAKITTNGQTLDTATNVLYSEMMMRPSTIDLPPSQLLKENIEAISTVLSSSGLNRQSSLKIATQTVIKKLEIDYEVSRLLYGMKTLSHSLVFPPQNIFFLSDVSSMLFGKKKKRPRYGSKPNGDWRIVLQRKLDNSHSNWITVSLITYLSTCEEEFSAH